MGLVIGGMRVEAPATRDLTQLYAAVLVHVLGGERDKRLVDLHGAHVENLRETRGAHRLV